jgi:hypothetical protein
MGQIDFLKGNLAKDHAALGPLQAILEKVKTESMARR